MQADRMPLTNRRIVGKRTSQGQGKQRDGHGMDGWMDG